MRLPTLGVVAVLAAACAPQIKHHDGATADLVASAEPAPKVRVPVKPNYPACQTYYDFGVMTEALRQEDYAWANSLERCGMIPDGTTATVIQRDWHTSLVFLHRDGITTGELVIPTEALE